jgi:hypothetical protein
MSEWIANYCSSALLILEGDEDSEEDNEKAGVGGCRKLQWTTEELSQSEKW